MFDGLTPNLQRVVQAFKDETHAWQFAVAKGLSILYLELGVVDRYGVGWFYRTGPALVFFYKLSYFPVVRSLLLSKVRSISLLLDYSFSLNTKICSAHACLRKKNF